MRIQAKITLLVGVLVITMGMAPAVDPPKEPVIFTNASGNWADCIGMPTGCQMLVLYGDVAKPGEFAVRFKYPARYRIGPHTHAGDEHATVISGGPFHIAVGDVFDATSASGQVAHTGDMLVVPAGTHHFAWADGATVLQVNGMAPFKREFLNPANNSSGVPK